MTLLWGFIPEAPSVPSDRSEDSPFSHSPTNRTYEPAHSDSVLLSSDDDPEDPVSSDVLHEYSGPAASEAGPSFYGSPMFDWLILEDNVRADEAFGREVQTRRKDPRRVWNVDALDKQLKRTYRETAERSRSRKEVIRLTDAIGRNQRVPIRSVVDMDFES